MTMQGVRPVGSVPETEVLVAAGLAGAVAAFTLVTLRVELEPPLLVGSLVVPVVVATGFLFALWFRVWLSVSMLQASGLLGLVLVLLVGAYEACRLLASEPLPPTARY
jgi:Zn-dependent membrane protease YugP